MPDDFKIVFESLPVDWEMVAPPKRPHVIKPDVPLKATSGLIGGGNLGKTTLLVEAAVHVIIGQPWHGRPVMQGDVVIVTWEDLTSDYHAKAYAFIQAHPELAKHADRIREGLHIAPMHTFGYHLVEATRSEGAVVTGLAEAVAAQIKARFPRAVWVIIETASRANAAGEDNLGMARLVEACEVIAHRIDVGVTISHHVSKNAIRSGLIDATAARGGSALVDNCRATSLLIPLDPSSPSELLPPGVTAADLRGRDVVVLISARSSHARKADALWLERKFSEDELPYFTALVVTDAQRDARRHAEEEQLLQVLIANFNSGQWYAERSIIRDSKHLHRMSEPATKATLHRLVERGDVEHEERLQYGTKGRLTHQYRVKEQP